MSDSTVNYASEVLNSLLNNEPAEAVDHFQSLIKQRAQDMVYSRFDPQSHEIEEEVQDDDTAV